MPAGVEKADAPRGVEVFPRRWIERGVQLGEGEHALTGWIRANIAEDRALGIGGGRSPRQRVVDLLERRDPPC